MRRISVEKGNFGIVSAGRSLREACFSSMYLLFFITKCSHILNFVVYNVWMQFEFIKSRQRLNYCKTCPEIQ
jgi:hypothetical protein